MDKRRPFSCLLEGVFSFFLLLLFIPFFSQFPHTFLKCALPTQTDQSPASSANKCALTQISIIGSSSSRSSGAVGAVSLLVQTKSSPFPFHLIRPCFLQNKHPVHLSHYQSLAAELMGVGSCWENGRRISDCVHRLPGSPNP